MSKVNILLLTWNRIEFLKTSLLCYLNMNSRSIPHTLVIADNGSTDGTKEYLQSIEGSLKSSYPNITVKIRYYTKNYGRPRIINHFFRLSDPDSEYLGVICDDVTTSSEWVNLASSTLDVFPEVGILGLNDGRDWCPVVERNGFGVYFGDGFFWNDDCYMMRKDVINELTKLKRKTYDSDNVTSGYILMNIWGMSEGCFYSNIRKTKYQLATTRDNIKCNISSTISSDKIKKHTLLIRRMFVKNTKKYWETTEGLMQWDEGGQNFSFLEEPKEEIKCNNFPDDASTPLSHLDGDMTEGDCNRLFLPEELKFWRE